MENRRPVARTHEAACERIAALFRSPWLRHYAARKLRSDPAFPGAYEILRGSQEPILDLGCGMGLLPFYLRERGVAQPITGFDLDERKVRTGTEIAESNYPGVKLRVHDARKPMPSFRGSLTLLDVLHYLDPARQETLLAELAAFVSPGGVLLLRDCPRDGSARYWLTRISEMFAQTISWNLKTALHFPSRISIEAAFPEEKFTRDEKSCWGATPFNNRLFVFRRRL